MDALKNAQKRVKYGKYLTSHSRQVCKKEVATGAQFI
jgi:hypothetical protein